MEPMAAGSSTRCQGARERRLHFGSGHLKSRQGGELYERPRKVSLAQLRMAVVGRVRRLVLGKLESKHEDPVLADCSRLSSTRDQGVPQEFEDARPRIPSRPCCAFGRPAPVHLFPGDRVL